MPLGLIVIQDTRVRRARSITRGARPYGNIAVRGKSDLMIAVLISRDVFILHIIARERDIIQNQSLFLQLRIECDERIKKDLPRTIGDLDPAIAEIFRIRIAHGSQRLRYVLGERSLRGIPAILGHLFKCYRDRHAGILPDKPGGNTRSAKRILCGNLKFSSRALIPSCSG